MLYFCPMLVIFTYHTVGGSPNYSFLLHWMEVLGSYLYLFNYLHIRLSAVGPSVPPTHLPTHPPTHPPIHPSIHPSIYPPTHPPVPLEGRFLIHFMLTFSKGFVIKRANSSTRISEWTEELNSDPVSQQDLT